MRRIVLSLSLALMMLSGAVAFAAPAPKAPATGPGPMTTGTFTPLAGCAWVQVGASSWAVDSTGTHKVQAVLQEYYSSVSGFCGYIRAVANFYDSSTPGEYYTHDQWISTGDGHKYAEVGPTYEGEPLVTSWTIYGPSSTAGIWCGYNAHATYDPPASSSVLSASTGGLCTF